MSIQIVLATANPDKMIEIEEILRANLSNEVELIARPSEIPDVEETGETLYENALLKADAICAATKLICVSDDTGLFVEALDGAPGVYSARYAGEDARYEDNVAKLLRALDGEANRRAQFRTVAVAKFPDGRELACVGEVDGTIALAPAGTDGFGYDPVFVPDEGGGRSFAELSLAEKHEISHRGRALRGLSSMMTRALTG